MNTIISKCNSKECVSDYQDTKYGNKMRVKNKTMKSYRCTVCGKDE